MLSDNHVIIELTPLRTSHPPLSSFLYNPTSFSIHPQTTSFSPFISLSLYIYQKSLSLYKVSSYPLQLQSSSVFEYTQSWTFNHKKVSWLQIMAEKEDLGLGLSLSFPHISSNPTQHNLLASSNLQKPSSWNDALTSSGLCFSIPHKVFPLILNLHAFRF